MRSTQPPRLATWLLTRVGRKNEALVGDLVEEYQRGRSAAWYWRQALTAILAEPLRLGLLIFAAVAVYRICAHVAIPGVDLGVFAPNWRLDTTFFGLMDAFVGGSLRHASILALGILPYVSAAIMVQALDGARRALRPAALPLERRRIRQSTWAIAMLLCIVQATGLAVFMESVRQAVPHAGWGFRLTTVMTLTSCTAALMWLSDRITLRGVGNGMFLLLLADMVIGLPRLIAGMAWGVEDGMLGPIRAAMLLVSLLVTLGVGAYAARGYRRAITE
jgi:preprotein translocase subunit SecY